MKKGDRVRWSDPITQRVKTGRLIEKNKVIFSQSINKAEDIDIENPKYKVSFWDWDIRCDQDGGRYCFSEADLEIIKPN